MPRFRIMQKLTDKLNSIIRELLDGILVIRVFNRQKSEEQKFAKANNEMTTVTLFTSRAMAVMPPIMMFIMYGFMLLILWFGAKEVDAGVMQAGSIMAFVMIAAVSIMLPRANAAAGRIQEVLAEKPTITSPFNAKPAPAGAQISASFPALFYS